MILVHLIHIYLDLRFNSHTWLLAKVLDSGV